MQIGANYQIHDSINSRNQHIVYLQTRAEVDFNAFDVNVYHILTPGNFAGVC